MDDILKFTTSHFSLLESTLDENKNMFAEETNKTIAAIERAKQLMFQKFGTNPKPTKRPMRAILDENEEEEEESVKQQQSKVSENTLRPSRTAKVNANTNLREIDNRAKLRNDNNVVVVNSKRNSSTTERRSSTKENSEPIVNDGKIERIKRSESVEIIKVIKTVEIDITKSDDQEIMPPPLLPIAKKQTKKGGKGKLVKSGSNEESSSEPNRVTRSKIKQEKISMDNIVEQNPIASSTIIETTISTVTTSTAPENSTISKKEKKTKKYPMPIIVKIEPQDSPETTCNATFDVPKNPKMNETVTIEPAQPSFTPMNETVTINKDGPITSPDINPHDSLMTEDNSIDEEELPLATFKATTKQAPQLPPKKKNEVFNPYVSSPIKQKIQAFEKQAQQAKTPEKYSTLPASSKYSALKNGTPSKIAMFNSKTTTPSTLSKVSRTYSTVSSSANRVLKKGTSISQESLESCDSGRLKQGIVALTHQQALEEKKRLREEKMRQAQITRENLEKEKREQAMKAQLERDEKHRKLLKEKEERQKQELLKKKLKKDQQLKKFNQEKERDMDDVKTLETTTSNSNNTSLLYKLQKQKAEAQKKLDLKNTYCFDMLETDDSTDDESDNKPGKRPPPPFWSKKEQRRPKIRMQNHMSARLLDSLFSVQPIDVDLREIFPSIDSKKLVRNSSAVWRTPPKSKYDI